MKSDGGCHRRIVNGKDYPAYSFWNKSDDIRALFMWACDLAGIRARQTNAVNISIARRPDGAALDRMLARPPFQPRGWLAEDRDFF